MTEHDEDKLQADFDELLDLVELLTEELGTELELHYTDDELPTLGNADTVQVLVRAAKVLRRHGLEPPGVVGSLLLAVVTAKGQA